MELRNAEGSVSQPEKREPIEEKGAKARVTVSDIGFSSLLLICLVTPTHRVAASAAAASHRSHSYCY